MRDPFKDHPFFTGWEEFKNEFDRTIRSGENLEILNTIEEHIKNIDPLINKLKNENTKYPKLYLYDIDAYLCKDNLVDYNIDPSDKNIELIESISSNLQSLYLDIKV